MPASMTTRSALRLLIVAAATAALGVIALLPRSTFADGTAAAKVGLSARPPVNVERFPLGDLRPVPMPELPQGRLVMEGLDGEIILDVVPFDPHGEPIAEAFEKINHAFRARNDHEVAVQPRLVELLITLSYAFEGRPLKLVSGHRVPGYGTSKTSYHVSGMAADVSIRGVKVRDLRKAAGRLGAKGLGLYPGFVHVDVRDDRPPYRWVGGGWRRWR